MNTRTRNQATTEIAEMLVRCRAERNMTLEDVSGATGLTSMTLSRIERGEAAPRRTTLLKLVEFLRKHGFFPKTVAA